MTKEFNSEIGQLKAILGTYDNKLLVKVQHRHFDAIRVLSDRSDKLSIKIGVLYGTYAELQLIPRLRIEGMSKVITSHEVDVRRLMFIGILLGLEDLRESISSRITFMYIKLLRDFDNNVLSVVATSMNDYVEKLSDLKIDYPTLTAEIDLILDEIKTYESTVEDLCTRLETLLSGFDSTDIEYILEEV